MNRILLAHASVQSCCNNYIAQKAPDSYVTPSCSTVRSSHPFLLLLLCFLLLFSPADMAKSAFRTRLESSCESAVAVKWPGPQPISIMTFCRPNAPSLKAMVANEAASSTTSLPQKPSLEHMSQCSIECFICVLSRTLQALLQQILAYFLSLSLQSNTQTTR